jgi:hypothetical protein
MPILLLLIVLPLIALMPLLLIQRYRAGSARRRSPRTLSPPASSPASSNNVIPGDLLFSARGRDWPSLTWSGARWRQGKSARRHLVFDQHRGDQVIGLISDENEAGRTAGITVWDRPDTPLAELITRYGQIDKLPAGAERARLEAAFEGFGATRTFVGKTRAREAVISLADAKGRERLRLVVTAEGTARIEFLDERGQPVRTLP